VQGVLTFGGHYGLFARGIFHLFRAASQALYRAPAAPPAILFCQNRQAVQGSIEFKPRQLRRDKGQSSLPVQRARRFRFCEGLRLFA